MDAAELLRKKQFAELQRIAEEVRADKKAHTNCGPSGLCFDWNRALARKLRSLLAERKKRSVAQNGEKVRLLYGTFRTDTKGPRTHYFVMIGRTVVDITTDQFKRYCKLEIPAVNVGRFRDRYRVTKDVSNQI